MHNARFAAASKIVKDSFRRNWMKNCSVMALAFTSNGNLAVMIRGVHNGLSLLTFTYIPVTITVIVAICYVN
jgi:hypothetical protein